MKHKHIFFLSLFLFIAISLLFHLYIPFVWPDEVLFFNPAWELRTNGIMRTSVLDGLIPGMDTHTLWMPPLYIIFLSWVFHIFPTELLTARLLSSFISLGSIYLVYRMCQKFQFSERRISGVLLLLASDLLLLKFSHTARMESLCLFFGVASIFFLIRRRGVEYVDGIDQRSGFINQFLANTSQDIFLSGICISLSFLSHPFGIVYSIPILFLLYQNGNFNLKSLALYTFAGFIPILMWGIYVIPNWELFLVQFGAQFSRKNELLGKFTWMDKVKIIFSVYKFPLIKLVLFILTIATYFYNLFFGLKKMREKMKTSTEYFFLVWLFTILGFLFVSSESWYAFHIVVPFTFVLSSLLEKEKFFFRGFVLVSLLYNAFVIVWVLYSNYFLYHIPEKTNAFFYMIEKEVKDKDFIYIQAIPDPYFYLKKKFPNKVLHEFIPGELSGMQRKNADGSEKISILQKLGLAKKNYKIDANFYRETIHKQDVFLFYNENLMNDYIREYISKNSAYFERKNLRIDMPKQSDLKLEVVVYKRK